MIDLLYFYPEGHQAHQEPGHPERPARVESMVAGLRQAGWWEPFPKTPPLELAPDVLHGVHDPRYLSLLQRACSQSYYLTMDTYTTPASWRLALNAAGGSAAVARSVWRGQAKSGFALARPPGHHATIQAGMGFCLLNNIALAAEYLLRQEGARKLAIVDLDLHHGNGTQDIFYQRSDVFYISAHQSPLFPGTGAIEERGAGEGLGANLNIPLPPGSGDAAFEAAMQEAILPELTNYRPEMLLVSIGFDPHWRDPLGSLLLSAGQLSRCVSHLQEFALAQCGGRLALFLEGGYDLDAAAACAQGCVAGLLGKEWIDPLGPSPRKEVDGWVEVLERVKKSNR